MSDVVVIIKTLVNKKSSISDNDILNIIKDTKEVLNKKNVPKQTRTFRSLVEAEDDKTTLLSLSTKDLIKYEFIYNFGIVYIDAFKTPNPLTIINHITNNKEIRDHSHTNHNPLVKKDAVNVGLSYFSDPFEKAKMFLQHLQSIRHFIYHHKEYKNPLNTTKQGIPVYGLASLLGNTQVVTVIGIILLSEEGKLQLQDEDSKIFLDCSSCLWDKAYFPIGSVVLCEGKYSNNLFKVIYILQPPLINNHRSFTEKIDHDYFGAVKKIVDTYTNKNAVIPQKSSSISGFTLLDKFDTRKKSYMFPLFYSNVFKSQLENLNPNIHKAKLNEEIFSYCSNIVQNLDFLIISNPNLADTNVLEHLDYLFKNLESSSPPPCMVVFMGNFLPDSSFSSFKNQEKYFDSLGKIIEKYETLNNNCIFAFVSGNEDIQVSGVFPQPCIPDYIENRLSKRIKHVLCCSNPARFSIFGKEILFLRDDLHKKLSRNSLGIIDKSKSTLFYMNTLFGQGNLAPLEQVKCSRVWHLSHSMMFTPPPDFLVVADLTEDFVYTENKQTTFINPGNFSRDMSFILFNPLKDSVQPCKVTIVCNNPQTTKLINN